jgi:N-acetyl-gamma-glutamyl-phosphate reductase
MNKIKTAIVGASGYSGEELLRILSHHPACAISIITSRQYAGSPVGDVFPRFAESNLFFSNPDIENIIAEADVAFLALPHGLAAEYAVPLLKSGVKVIDISADFRIRDPEIYTKYYKIDHPAPELLKEAVYGLPELYRNEIKGSSLIACAGCYPTSILLPSVPLLKSGLVSSENIFVASMSGISGAGRKVDLPYIFPECNESVRAYAVSGHRHISEIEQELSLAADTDVLINFLPHLVPVNRGINSTLVFRITDSFSMDAVKDILEKAYADEPFVRILSDAKLADTKHVTMTNVCEIGCVYDEHTNTLIVTSSIDNLTKGASGQAVQCMNIMCGLDESAGLIG